MVTSRATDRRCASLGHGVTITEKTRVARAGPRPWSHRTNRGEARGWRRPVPRGSQWPWLSRARSPPGVRDHAGVQVERSCHRSFKRQRGKLCVQGRRLSTRWSACRPPENLRPSCS